LQLEAEKLTGDISLPFLRFQHAIIPPGINQFIS